MITLTDEQITEQMQNSKVRSDFNEYVLKNFQNGNELIEKFDRLTKIYYEVNSVINISALRIVDDIYLKHYLDSIQPIKYFNGESIADIGCGGGFPTIPLAITTGKKVVGIESIGKKLSLIKRVIPELDLNNLDYRYARAEEVAKNNELYDNVTARAVADTDKVLSYCAPLAKPNGLIILYKSKNDEKAKTQTLKKCGTKLVDVIEYTLFNTDIGRRLFIYSKNKD